MAAELTATGGDASGGPSYKPGQSPDMGTEEHPGGPQRAAGAARRGIMADALPLRPRAAPHAASHLRGPGSD
jgi:hypothetical protein